LPATDNTQKKAIRAWCLYDWANSAFATTVMAAMLPIYFRGVAASSLPLPQKHLAVSLWGYTTAVSMLCVSILSLLLGPYSDLSGRKKHYLGGFAFFGVLATCLLSVTGTGHWPWVALLFILAKIGFAGSEVFYDALLPHLAGRDALDRISTRAYAWGYVGGGLLLAVNIAMVYYLPKQILEPGGDPMPALGMQLSFLSAGLWWGLFSIPLFRHVPEPAGQGKPAASSIFRESLIRLKETFSDIRRYRPAFLFILAFWFYNDGIGTIIKMATVYGSEIGIGTLDLVGALLLTQFVGIPCSLLFGRIAGRVGAKRAILAGIGVYGLISLGGFLMASALHFWILAFVVGLVQGGTQALSRSYYAVLIPKDKSAEFFSFYNISGKFAGILGPALFGLINQLSGNSRLGILSLLFFFITGGILLWRVPDPAGPGSRDTRLHPD